MIRRLLRRWFEWVPPLIIILIAIGVIKYLEAQRELTH